MLRLETKNFCFIAFADFAPDPQPHLLLWDTKQRGCFSFWFLVTYSGSNTGSATLPTTQGIPSSQGRTLIYVLLLFRSCTGSANPTYYSGIPSSKGVRSIHVLLTFENKSCNVPSHQTIPAPTCTTPKNNFGNGFLLFWTLENTYCNSL
jgi:hypothetical protein